MCVSSMISCGKINCVLLYGMVVLRTVFYRNSYVISWKNHALESVIEGHDNIGNGCVVNTL
jgi:hypothetical protein